MSGIKRHKGAVSTWTTTMIKPVIEALNPDVYLCIIDQLHGDKASLSNASLVSHSWLSPCQAHLFSSLRIYGIVEEGFPFGPEGFLQFLEKNPKIAGYVHQLELLNQYLPELSRSMRVKCAGRLQRMDLSLCFAIVSNLPKLKHLEMCQPAFGYSVALPPQLPSITSLHLHHLKFTDAAPISLWEILRPFSNLRALFMYGVRVPRGAGQDESASPRLPIETLTLPSLCLRTEEWEGGRRRIPDNMPLFIGLIDRGFLQSTSTLEIGLNYDRDDSLSICDDVFNKVASQLRHLTFHVTARGSDNLWPRLNKCSHVHSIVYTFPDKFIPELAGKLWGAVMDSLDTLPLNTNLRSITIEAPFDIPSMDEYVDWDRFASIVGTRGAKILLRFVDINRTHQDIFSRLEWVHTVLRLRLADLFERGILQVERIAVKQTR